MKAYANLNPNTNSSKVEMINKIINEKVGLLKPFDKTTRDLFMSDVPNDGPYHFSVFSEMNETIDEAFEKGQKLFEKCQEMFGEFGDLKERMFFIPESKLDAVLEGLNSIDAFSYSKDESKSYYIINAYKNICNLLRDNSEFNLDISSKCITSV